MSHEDFVRQHEREWAHAEARRKENREVLKKVRQELETTNRGSNAVQGTIPYILHRLTRRKVARWRWQRRRARAIIWLEDHGWSLALGTVAGIVLISVALIAWRLL